MAAHRSLDKYILIATLLSDVSKRHGAVFNRSNLLKTLKVLERRSQAEGEAFFTKTLPRLGKAFDKALSGECPLDATTLRFKPMRGSKLPKFLGELFQWVLHRDGANLQVPLTADELREQCRCVEDIRIVLYSFYKYKLPYAPEQEQKVLSKFERTEEELVESDAGITRLGRVLSELCPTRGNNEPLLVPSGHQEMSAETPEGCVGQQGRGTVPPPSGKPDDGGNLPSAVSDDLRVLPRRPNQVTWPDGRRFLAELGKVQVAREAKILLSKVFANFDPTDIYPRHGPGVVATKQRLWSKYEWSNVCGRITAQYPLDAYFYASLGAVCDRLKEFNSLTHEDLPARVLLVPKDSRGPRLISCEPVDFQWVQQGLGRALVDWVERHHLTKGCVNFTDQCPNTYGALLGSKYGSYATLDLNEASDRVSLELVRLLFPSHVCEALEACRSRATTLPNGKVLVLRKHAPMGSSLCFPVMALCIWALLTAGAHDAHSIQTGRKNDLQERMLVYGDDVIVPTAYAESAIRILESFGLKINRDKSCLHGFFRESCGMDAFKGYPVAPVRLKTVWTSRPSPECYVSYVAYANEYWQRGYYGTYHYLVELLADHYSPIPDRSLTKSDKDLPWVPERARVNPNRKYNKQARNLSKRFQRKLYYSLEVETPKVIHEMDGWSMLLRYFAEKANPLNKANNLGKKEMSDPEKDRFLSPYARERDLLDRLPLQAEQSLASVVAGAEPFRVSTYTRRSTSKLVRRWR